jgi:iron complex outermembrane recepter protein
MKNSPIRRIILVLLACMAGVAAARAPEEPVRLSELADLDLEQLSKITVTSVSRRPERILDAAASIFVLTAEDIRRSGATSLPEVLRLAPNLQVVRADTSQYLVNARGGLSGTANKMLVLIDGRTVYTPLFAGVFWDSQIVPLDDVERIEVISGPGSTLWGTNAVNGVINITTRSAANSQGILVTGVAGDMEKGVNARIGAPLAGDAHYRAYARYFDRKALSLASGASALDETQRWQTGFRADWGQAARSVTVQGDLYSADVGNLGGARETSGANVLARWRVRQNDASEFFVRAYYDRTEREHVGSFQEKRDTVDLEMQHGLDVSPIQHLVWGAGYRASRDRTVNTPVLGFMPPKRTLGLASLFAQDQISVARRLDATLGLRVERNDYTGVEWLPNARLAYSLSPDHLLWSAITRTVRQPSRIDRDLVVPGMPPFVLVPNDTFDSEIAHVGEVGYRAKVADGVTVSFTAFHHEFRKLRTLEPSAEGLIVANGARGSRTGLEGWGDIAVTRDWRLSWGFVAMKHHFALEPGRVDLGGGGNGNDPELTAMLRSAWNATRNHELDVVVRHVDDLPNPRVPSYTVVDARFGWRVSPSLELSLLVFNALDRKHSEFGSPAERAVLERSFLLKATWSP